MGIQKKGKLYEFKTLSKQSQQASGETAMVSGIYRVKHSHDPFVTRKDLLINKGAELPACAICGRPVQFRLVKKVDHISEDPDFS